MTSRRTFSKLLVACALSSADGSLALGHSMRLQPGGSGSSRFAQQNCPAEWSYRSGKAYSDPFNEIELDVIFTAPSGRKQKVPAFWAGGSEWRVRYSPPEVGDYKFQTVCTDTSNSDIHGLTGSLTAIPYSGANPLYRHGMVRVAKDQRHFEQADGTPFFWLGDTWWMGLCKRLRWPDGFQALTSDRVRKGFTVVQIVAGLYPDMPPFDSRGANEAGFPWEPDYARINPAYFDTADLRIEHLADNGIAPCVVGCWGYFLPWMGVRKIKQHWRYIVARWGAYPAFWCLAGEATMPFYLSKDKKHDAEVQKQGWTEVARYVRAIDPYHHPISLHPSHSSRDCVTDPGVLDFDMLQTGHGGHLSVPNTINSVTQSLEASPKMPVLVAEVCYEGIMQGSWQNIQRYMFWASILSGAGGHTYGANGLWQVNQRSKPYGSSPYGHSWGGPPWETAAALPGSAQLGLAASLLRKYPWWKLKPRPDMVSPHWTRKDYWQPFAAEAPGELVVAFSPSGWTTLRFTGLAPQTYRAFFFNVGNGARRELGNVTPNAQGAWNAPQFVVLRDWAVVLEHKA